ncbi:PsbP-related protein [Methanobacterium oryzae]|uniref:PsbP-related protein n=1 Tax=Methanobacterium oryzae TaxID=69540 RepID=UPI003D1DDE5A
MKKYLLILILLSAVVTASGCTDGGNQTENTTLNQTNTYSGDDFTVNYPQDWEQLSSKAQNSVVAFGDPNSADGNGNVQINVVIQKVVKPNGTTLQQYFNATYTQFASQNLGYQPISEGNITVNGVTALENVYKINSGTAKQQRAVWIEKKNLPVVYIILCSAPVSDYNAQQQNFDMIVNSFKLI